MLSRLSLYVYRTHRIHYSKVRTKDSASAETVIAAFPHHVKQFNAHTISDRGGATVNRDAMMRREFFFFSVMAAAPTPTPTHILLLYAQACRSKREWRRGRADSLLRSTARKSATFALGLNYVQFTKQGLKPLEGLWGGGGGGVAKSSLTYLSVQLFCFRRLSLKQRTTSVSEHEREQERECERANKGVRTHILLFYYFISYKCEKCDKLYI